MSREPDSARLGRVARGGSAGVLGTFITALSLLGATVAITRMATPETAGVLFSATSVFVLAVAMGQLGTNTGLVYFLSRARVIRDANQLRIYAAAASGPVVIASVAIGLTLFVCASPLATLVTPDQVQQSESFLQIFAVFIPLAVVENAALAATRGLGTMRASVLVEQMGRPLLQLALIIGALAFTDGLEVAWAWVLPYLPAALIAILWWRRAMHATSRKLLDSGHGFSAAAHAANGETSPRALRRNFWRFTGPRALANIGQSAIQRLDIVVVGALAGATAAAIYTATTRFVVAGQMVNTAMSFAVQPSLAEAITCDDIPQARRFYQVATAWLILATWPLYMVLLVWGDQLLVVFGQDYQAGSTVLLVLAAAMLVAMGSGMVDSVLNMAGRTTWNLMNVFIAAGVQFVLLFLLVPKQGILGAALAWSAAIMAAKLIPLLQIAITLGMHPMSRATLTAGLLTGLCWGVVPLLVRHFGDVSWTGFMTAAALALIFYAPALWLARSPLELASFIALRQRKSQRRVANPSAESPR
ncbi:MAG: lipopolysaccharide biosynthesis protein [Actinomycetota bacterium]